MKWLGVGEKRTAIRAVDSNKLITTMAQHASTRDDFEIDALTAILTTERCAID